MKKPRRQRRLPLRAVAASGALRSAGSKLRYVIRPTPEGGGGTEPPADVTLDSGTTENPNNYSDGTAENPYVVAGAGIGVTILDGHLDFGSYQEFRDMTIQAPEGNANQTSTSIWNKDGASNTVFRRCRFRGGASTGWYNGANVLLGAGHDLSDLTLIECEVERALGTGEKNTVNTYADGCTIDTVTWDGCHLGVSNGTSTGASRMLVENWTAHSGASWWKDITFTGCEFEATEKWCLDFACYPDSGRATGVVVSGCLFHGAGTVASDQGCAIDLEWPDAVLITGNHFHRCRSSAIYCALTEDFDNDTGWVITDNTFDWDTAESGIANNFPPLYICSSNNVITGNTVTCNSDTAFWSNSALLAQNYSGAVADGCISTVCTGNTIERNIFYLNGTRAPYAQVGGASNTFDQSATNPPTGTYNAVVRT